MPKDIIGSHVIAGGKEMGKTVDNGHNIQPNLSFNLNVYVCEHITAFDSLLTELLYQ